MLSNNELSKTIMSLTNNNCQTLLVIVEPIFYAI